MFFIFSSLQVTILLPVISDVSLVAQKVLQERNVKKVKISIIGVLLTTFWTVGAISSVNYNYDGGFIKGKLVIYSFKLYQYPLINSLLGGKLSESMLMVIKYLLVFHYSKGFLEIIHEYEMFDMEFLQHAGKNTSQIIFKHDNLIVMILIVCCVTCELKTIVLLFVEDLATYGVIMYALQDIYKLLSQTVELQYGLLSIMLYLRLAAINNYLSEADYNMNKFMKGFKQSKRKIMLIKNPNYDFQSFKLWEKIKWVKSMNCKLLKQKDRILECYSTVMLLTAVMIAKNIVVSSYLICRLYFIKKDEKSLVKALMYIILSAGSDIIRLIFVCEPGHLVASELQKMHYVLLDFDGSKRSKIVTEEVRIFHDQIGCTLKQFNAYGMVNLDTSLIFNVLATILSYSIVFIQNYN